MELRVPVGEEDRAFVASLVAALQREGWQAGQEESDGAVVLRVEMSAAQEARLLALVAEVAAEYRGQSLLHDDTVGALRQEIAARFEARGASWPWQDRLKALESLGRLGDPRLPDPRTLTAFTPASGWVQVAAGTHTAGFYMRTWPVTVQEFTAFVAEGWDKPEYWTEGRETEQKPDDWLKQQRRPNCPVVSVSWYAARAFCRWAQAEWSLPAAGVLDLPTSQEREIAARGTGRVYPWGDEAPGEEDTARASYSWIEEYDDNPYGTGRYGSGPFLAHGGCTPVGAFPTGHTPEQGRAGPLWDMGGNVREWCASLFKAGQHMDVPRQMDDTYHHKYDRYQEYATLYVLRGGSWYDYAPSLCVVYRMMIHLKRDPDTGFRLVVRLR